MSLEILNWKFQLSIRILSDKLSILGVFKQSSHLEAGE